MTAGPADRRARRRALDPSRSFIVQAPAGSGKTELLIQRYLRLLGGVERPEQIVAITFTRKAAAEMRTRILAALAEAAAPDAVAPHRETTQRLAQAALARDRALDWGLLAQPQRLRIDTLDALNAWLARQLPLLSGGVAGAEVADDCTEHYRRAARRTVDEISSQGAVAGALRSLLGILDNSVPRLESMLADLLPNRDQWLRHIAGFDDTALRAELEASLQRLLADELETVQVLSPPGWLEALLPLGRHAAEHAEQPGERAQLAALLEPAAGPVPAAEALPAWQALAQLLLTGTGTWRKRLSKSLGFGAEHPAQKRALADLLDEVRDHDALRLSLQRVAALPDAVYADPQWQDLAALRCVLTRLVAELRVAFAESGRVDFVELAMGAQRALGQVDRPSDLLLALDRRIQHLLIDEFQDTSQAQLQLIELLTSGWEPGDGRSLFLVGDPMQSIYRFRDADMSLFLKLKQRPIGQIRLELLILSSNFRSAPAVIDWVNGSFAAIFPDRDLLAKGAARFYPSHAERPAQPDHGVELHLLRGSSIDDEHQRVVELIERERARSETQSIAILVRSRTHLLGLRQRLRQYDWPVHAVEIDPVSESQAGQDLIGLARALAHIGDRIAWLGLLRSPCCGLNWRDLEALAGDAPDRAVWDLIHEAPCLQRMSDDGRRRVAFVRRVVGDAFENFGSLPYAEWVERTWRALRGPECLRSEQDADQAEQFFDLLRTLTADGDIDDPARLETAFLKPRGQGDPPRRAGVEIMTLHRAKGLEFDTVIVFGLGRLPRGDRPKALYWTERVNSRGDSDLLMAPLPRDDDRLTRYLRNLDREQELAELARLFYVGATRARDRLHLVAQLKPDRDAPADGSLLGCIWPSRGTDFIANETGLAATASAPASLQPRLFRRCNGFDDGEAAAPAADDAAPAARPEFEWAGSAAPHIGTVVHAELQRMAESGLDDWDATRIDAAHGRFERQLALLGVERAERAPAADRVADALRKVLSDERYGRWLLGPRADAASELRLSIRGPSGIEHVQLDRSFVDDGVRWIIDYKTSSHQGGDLEAFLDSEVARYRPQLERYARYYAEIDPRPIRVGLYFPLLGAFRDWRPG